MQENVPVLLVLSVCDKEIILEKGEILCEKRHFAISLFHSSFRNRFFLKDKSVFT